MSIIADLLFSASTHETKQPTFSLIHNAIRKEGKYRAATVEAYCPYTLPAQTGADDLLYFLKAVVPYYLVPATKLDDDYWRTALDLDEAGYKKVAAAVAAENCPRLDFHLFTYFYGLRDVDYFDNRKELPGSPFTLRPTVSWGKWTTFRDAAGLHVASHNQDLLLFYDRIQACLTMSAQKGYFKEVLIGKKGFSCTGKVSDNPKDTIRIGQQAMRLTIPAWDISPRESRHYWTHINLLACALHNLYEVLMKHTKDTDKFGVLGDGDFWMCMATYIAGSYGGMNKSINMDRRLTSDGMESKVLSYMGLPFSQAYPYMNLQFRHGNRAANNQAMAEAIKATFFVNICLCFAAEAVGMRLIPVDYVQASATVNRFTIKGLIARTLTPSRDAGGSGEPFFMPIPTITDTMVEDEYPFYMPWPVSKGMNEYVPGTKRPETFGSMMIDRGEAMIAPDGDEDKVNLVGVTRDVKVYDLPHFDDSFTIVKYPIPAADVSNSLLPLHWILAYVTDGTLKPGPMLRTNESICMPKASYPQKSWKPVYQQPITGVSSSGKKVVSEEVHPMPGGIGPGMSVDRLITEKPQFKGVTTDERPQITDTLGVGATKGELPNGTPGPVLDVSEKAKVNK